MDKINNLMVATDFSPNADHALVYGISLAEKLNAAVTVFHGYNLADTSRVPASTVGMGYVYEGPNPEKMQSWVQENFEQIKQEYFSGKDLKVDFVSKLGVIEDNMMEALREYHSDLLVMGAKGAHGLDIILGSTTTDMIKKSVCPLLIVPEQVNFEEVNKISFAFDNQDIENASHVDTLVTMASQLNASVEVLTVKTYEEEISYGPNLEQVLKPVRHHYHSVVNKDIEEGINQFIKNNKVDWLAMIPIKHNLFERIFKGNVVKKMAFHTEIPLLVFYR